MESLKEEKVEDLLCNHLEDNGWVVKNRHTKDLGEHGCDIIAFHPKWRKYYYIECKGDGKAKNQTVHNSFYTLFGQILSRMDIEGNNPKKARYYALAIPASWEKTFKNKIKKMPFGWKLLKLEVFLVSKTKVEKKSYSYFLK
ncbi:MAG: hypothetical protein KBB75_02115 [Candidatus Pacebacteria bacterium]|jgi:hypothetical protein|nr:hypothetical protein [Candidatus Paceibacterota bacterium]